MVLHEYFRDSSGESGTDSESGSVSSPSSPAPSHSSSRAARQSPSANSQNANHSNSPPQSPDTKSPGRRSSRHSSAESSRSESSRSDRSRSGSPVRTTRRNLTSRLSNSSDSRSPRNSPKPSSSRVSSPESQSSQKSNTRKSRIRQRNSRSNSKSPKSSRSNSPSSSRNDAQALQDKSRHSDDSGDDKSLTEDDKLPTSTRDSLDNDDLKRKYLTDQSESDVDDGMKKVKGLIDTDSEDDFQPKKDLEDEPTANALFGDASDISSDEEKEKRQENQKEDTEGEDRPITFENERSVSRSPEPSGSAAPEMPDIPNEEDANVEEEPEPLPETRIDVEIPKITTDLGRNIHFVKLPNFLSVETRPFDQETYEDEIDEEETLDEEGRARLKLKVENTIRWREIFDDDGTVQKESNARFVKWSDGSMSLHLGSEIFDVYRQPLQGDHNHLYIRQGTGLQGQAVFRTKLTFRPHSTESFTHRKMTMSLADRSQKTSGIKVLSQVGTNPDQNRYEMIKKEEEKLRMSMRVPTKAKKSNGGSRNTNRNTNSYANETYNDDLSDDEGAISLAAIKNKYKKQSNAKIASNIYSSDEESSDIETVRPKKNTKHKALKDSDESNSESEGEGESESEQDDDNGDKNEADNASDDN